MKTIVPLNTNTAPLYSIAWQLDYMRGKLTVIPAFGDSIGKDVNKAELGTCAKYAQNAMESHAALVAALKGLCADRYLADPINADRMKQARAALALATL